MEKYTLLIQNNVTKQFYVYDLNKISEDTLYYCFDVEVGDVPDGEYSYILYENPDQSSLVVNVNNISKSEFRRREIILTDKSDILKAQNFILITYKAEDSESQVYITYSNSLLNDTRIYTNGQEMTVAASGLMRIGEYEANTTYYDKPNQYIAYEG